MRKFKVTQSKKKSVKSTGGKVKKDLPQIDPFIDYLTPSIIEFKPKHILIGELYKRYYYVSYPGDMDKEAWINDVMKYPFANIIYYVSRAEKAKFVKNLKQTMNVLDNIRSKEQVTEYAKTEATQKLNNFRNLQIKLQEGNEKMVDFTLIIEVSAKDLESLEANARVVKEQLSNIDLVGKLFTLNQKEAFESCLPFNTLHPKVKNTGSRNMPTLSASSIFPFSYGRFHEDKGIYLGTDSMNGMVIVNFFKRGGDRTDSNIVILGKSGVGKSTLMKKIMRGEYGRGKKIIIIDPEREYKEMCDLYGGTWLNCAGGKNKINPLQVTDLGADLDEVEEEDKMPLVLHFQRLRSYLKLYNPELKKDMLMDYMEILLEKAYEEKGINFQTGPSKIAAMANEDFPIFEDVLKFATEEKNKSKEQQLQDDFNKYNKLEIILRKLVRGSDQHLNGHTNIKLDSNFIVLDIHDLLDADLNFLRAQTLNILNLVWKIATDKSIETEVFIDEFHLLGDEDNPEGLKALKNFVKRFRKYESSLTPGTQNVSDVLRKGVRDYTEAIINNSTYQFFFGMGDKDLETLSKMMKLSENEEILLSKKQRGLCLFTAGSKRMELDIKVSDDELAMFGKGGGR